MESDIGHIITIILFAIWFFGIYYCRKVAMRLSKNGSNAILAGIFLPGLSWIIYSVYSFRNNTKEARVKTTKIIVGVAIFIAFLFAGIIYYVIGTPQYSLYKLKKAIINNNNTEFEKYFDTKKVADGLNETEAQLEGDIKSSNISILEIKEENPSKGKNDGAYISTDLTGKNLKEAILSFSNNNSSPQISLKFNAEGSRLFAEITKRNIGKTIAFFLSGQLISAPTVQTEITDGKAEISGQFNVEQVRAYTKKINTEKISLLDGLEIKDIKINGSSAEITLANIDGNITKINMLQTQGRCWKIVGVDMSGFTIGTKLPAPEGEKVATFNWKYKGKNYSLDEKLYDSFYKFYNSLPAGTVFNGESAVGWLEKNNDIFLNKVNGDNSLSELAQALKDIGDKNNFDENQLAELVATFIQNIPYDTEKFNNIKSGTKEKMYYPYEVLFNNKGVCSDKSYLAYSLLRNLGYGVSIFLFPEDQHMAIGVKCPVEYSNYDSGYCFLETTTLGNKIGSPPNLSKEFGTATSKIELSDFSDDSTESEYSPLGRIEILNKSDGLTYTGIIDTIKTQKEIDSLNASINVQGGSLKSLRAVIKNEESDIKDTESKLKSLEKKGDYSGYKNLYSSYSKDFSKYKNDIKEYNGKIAIYNQAISKYNQLLKSFYQ